MERITPRVARACRPAMSMNLGSKRGESRVGLLARVRPRQLAAFVSNCYEKVCGRQSGLVPAVTFIF